MSKLLDDAKRNGLSEFLRELRTGGEVGMTIEEWAKDFKSYVNELQMPRDDYKGIMEYIDDALALLKEQEAVTPEREHSGGGTTWWNVCGNCKTAINPNDKFCHECGKQVKWE